jgi:hypothetical protein
MLIRSLNEDSHKTKLRKNASMTGHSRFSRIFNDFEMKLFLSATEATQFTEEYQSIFNSIQVNDSDSIYEAISLQRLGKIEKEELKNHIPNCEEIETKALQMLDNIISMACTVLLNSQGELRDEFVQLIDNTQWEQAFLENPDKCTVSIMSSFIQTITQNISASVLENRVIKDFQARHLFLDGILNDHRCLVKDKIINTFPAKMIVLQLIEQRKRGLINIDTLQTVISEDLKKEIEIETSDLYQKRIMFWLSVLKYLGSRDKSCYAILHSILIDMPDFQKELTSNAEKYKGKIASPAPDALDAEKAQGDSKGEEKTEDHFTTDLSTFLISRDIAYLKNKIIGDYNIKMSPIYKIKTQEEMEIIKELELISSNDIKTLDDYLKMLQKYEGKCGDRFVTSSIKPIITAQIKMLQKILPGLTSENIEDITESPSNDSSDQPNGPETGRSPSSSKSPRAKLSLFQPDLDTASNKPKPQAQTAISLQKTGGL